MNTNQTPPGIVAFMWPETDNVLIEAKKYQHYDSFVKVHLDRKFPIWKISVDGTGWSVGDLAKLGYDTFRIDKFEWHEESKAWAVYVTDMDEDHKFQPGTLWIGNLTKLPAQSQSEGIDYDELYESGHSFPPTNPTVPDSGGEEVKDKINDTLRKFAEGKLSEPPTNQGEAVGKSKEEFLYTKSYPGLNWRYEVGEKWIIEKEALAAMQAYADQEVEKWKIESETRLRKELREEYALGFKDGKQQLKEKQGWRDEDMWRAKEFGEINGAKTGYAKQLWEDWLTEYKSKTGM